MRKTSKMNKLRKFAAILAVATTAIGSIASGLSLDASAAKAATQPNSQTTSDKKEDTQDLLDLRMIFTTDLHGMVSSTDYLSGTDYKNQGLSLAYPLIQKTKAEKHDSNVFTFDTGDVLFEASMEYIYGQDEEAIQPLYMAMALVGYDAITLGNHDFDYGKEYILRQLTYSGLMDKTVVSNLVNAKDDSYPFHENMIIEREAITQQGNKVNVKVGVIGETIPTLSAKTDNYTGIWKTEDIVANVKKEAEYLKNQGADIIVVLAHSGFGDEEPVENADNVSYALTKIEDVDVILCGHEHNEFPVAQKSGTYYNYTGVDANTGLVNGKLIVMAKSQGKSIGVADLTLSYDEDGDYTIEKQAGEVRKVSDYNLKEDQDILACIEGWEEELETYRTKELAVLEDGVTLQNYLGLLGDSETLQLQNDARIAYARNYIETTDKTYAGYPVIAAASHISYGANSHDDFVNISGSISTADLFTIQNYRNYTYLYKITGAQLKEWLELSASAYSTLTGETQFLVNSDWMEDWSKFYVFDGINYKVNPYVEPRYDVKGKKISNSNRVSNVTYNGKTVSDDMELIIACNTITPTGIFSWAADQKVKGMYRTQNIIIDYLTSVSLLGKFTPRVDNNWTLAIKEGQEFLMMVPNQGVKFAKEHTMYDSTVIEMEDKTVMKFKATETKVTEPYIVAQQSVLDPTNKAYAVNVDAFSSVGIKTIKYLAKDTAPDSTDWYAAREIEHNQFNVFFNETYTIMAEDNNGKKVFYKVKVDNIGTKEMAAPKVWSVTNAKTVITGRSEAGAMVYIELADKTYSKKANSDGAYSITIPAQVSGTNFYVYAKDLENERESGKTKVYVKYAGPNVISVDKYYNNSQNLTGITPDKDNFIIVIDGDSRTIYVPDEKSAEVVRTTEQVDFSKYVITVANQKIDADGRFEIDLPNIQIGSELRIVNMDYVGRLGVSSYVTVAEAGPYAPEFFDVMEGENVICGNAESPLSDKVVTVVVNVDGIDHVVSSDNKGNFKVSLSSPITLETQITAFAKDIKGTTVRSSKIVTEKVASIATYEKSPSMTISKTAYNSTSLTVTYEPEEDISIFIPYVSGETVVKTTLGADGTYSMNLKGKMIEGGFVRVVSRNNLGKLNDCSYSLVTYSQPSKPTLITELNNTAKYLQAVTVKDCSLIVDIGDKSYTSEKGTYSDEYKGYVHTIRFDRLASGTKISMYAKNVTTNSKRSFHVVKKKAPDSPNVETIQTVTGGGFQITGSVELFLINSQKKPTVKLTKTAVYARVNGTTYSGTVNEDGTFSIKLPAVKEDSKITVFAYNRYGYGPETSYKLADFK